MKLVKLKNGINLIIIPVVGLRSVTVEAMVHLGAKNEARKEAGLSHFLEHLAFKGTEKRVGAMSIFKEMDERGAAYEAETGLEHTAYHVTTSKANKTWAVEILADILFRSTYPAEEVIKERGVIIEEINMYQDNPMMGLGSELNKWLYGKSSQGCWNISGEIEDVKDVERKDIFDYRNNHFSTDKLTVVMSGNVDDTDGKLLIEYFDIDKIEAKVKNLSLKIELTEEKEKVFKREIEQAHLAVMVPTFGSQDKRRYAAKLADLILAGNASSRLFEKIRSDKGLAYYVFSAGETIAEAGYWAVQAGVANKNVSETMDIVESEILDFKDTVSEDELTRAKKYLEGRIELLMDRSEFWAEFVAGKFLDDGVLVSPEEELQKIRETGLNEIKEFANEVFKKEKVKKMWITKK